MACNVIFPIGSNFPIVSTLLWGIKILLSDTEVFFPNVSLSCLHLKAVFQHYFMSFVHPMQSKALQSSFYLLLAFLQWHFVLVVKYQVKFSLVFIISVAYCIFDMTPYESFLLIKNGLLNLKQLVLVTFLLLQHLYILSYHPSNLTSFEMPEILTKTQLNRKLLNIERKIITKKIGLVSVHYLCCLNI